MPTDWMRRAASTCATLLALSVPAALPGAVLAKDTPEKPTFTMAVGGLPGLAECREKNSHEQGDDADHDQQFHQREAAAAGSANWAIRP